MTLFVPIPLQARALAPCPASKATILELYALAFESGWKPLSLSRRDIEAFGGLSARKVEALLSALEGAGLVEVEGGDRRRSRAVRVISPTKSGPLAHHPADHALNHPADHEETPPLARNGVQADHPTNHPTNHAADQKRTTRARGSLLERERILKGDWSSHPLQTTLPDGSPFEVQPGRGKSAPSEKHVTNDVVRIFAAWASRNERPAASRLDKGRAAYIFGALEGGHTVADLLLLLSFAAEAPVGDNGLPERFVRVWRGSSGSDNPDLSMLFRHEKLARNVEMAQRWARRGGGRAVEAAAEHRAGMALWQRLRKAAARGSLADVRSDLGQDQIAAVWSVMKAANLTTESLDKPDRDGILANRFAQQWASRTAPRHHNGAHR